MTQVPCIRRFRSTVEGALDMADEPDPERLRALEARLARVKGEAKPQRSGMGKGFSQGEVAWRMVIELAAGIMIGGGIGYGLDVLFGTLPIFLIIFVMFGFAAGVKTMLRTASELRGKDAPGQPGQGEGD